MISKSSKLLLIAFSNNSLGYEYFSKLGENTSVKVKVFRYGAHHKISWHAWKKTPWRQLNRIAKIGVITSWRKNNRLDNTFFMGVYQLMKLLEACFLFNRYYSYLIKQSGCFVAMWNGNKFEPSVVKLAARKSGCKLIYWENGLLPQTTTMDDKGINYLNSLSRSANFYRQLPDTFNKLPDKLTARQFHADKKIRGSKIQIPKNYIFVPFQVNADSQILLHSPWIKDMHYLFTILVAVCSKLADKNIKLIIKEHPSCLSNYDKEHELAELNDRIFFANLNDTQELIYNSQAVITINSTVGMEALLLDKKVISLGQACYNLSGITQTASSVKELIQAIDSISYWNVDEELRKKFIGFVYNEYSIPCVFQKANTKHWQKINDRLHKIMNGVSWL